MAEFFGSGIKLCGGYDCAGYMNPFSQKTFKKKTTPLNRDPTPQLFHTSGTPGHRGTQPRSIPSYSESTDNFCHK